MSHIRRPIANRILFACLAAAVPLVAGCGRTPESSAQEPTPEGVQVTVAKADEQPVPRVVSVVGTLFAFEEAVVGNKAEGRVAEVRVDIGDRVKPGAVLGRIDPTDFQWTERHARHGLSEALAALEQTMIETATEPEFPADLKVDSLSGVRKAVAQLEQARAEAKYIASVVGSAKARVASADAELKNAADKWVRNQRLRTTGVITEQELLDTKTRHDIALAAHDSALADLNSAEARVATAKAAVPAAEAQVSAVGAEMLGRIATARKMWTALMIARKNLADVDVVAPAIPGDPDTQTRRWVVAQKLAAGGEYRKVGEPMLRLVVTDVLKLHLKVPEQHLNDVKLEQKVELFTDATGAKAIIGTVERIRPVVDTVTRNFDVIVRVPNDDGRLSPGVFVRARIAIRVDPSVVTVPLKAVTTFAGVTKVFVVVDGLARDRPVALGERLGERVEILSGLRKGETVVLSGQRLLADKSPVRIVPEAPKAAPR